MLNFATVILTIASLGFFILASVGLIKPSLLKGKDGRPLTRGESVGGGLAIGVALIFLAGIIAPGAADSESLESVTSSEVKEEHVETSENTSTEPVETLPVTDAVTSSTEEVRTVETTQNIVESAEVASTPQKEPESTPITPNKTHYTVESVVDGDTIKIRVGTELKTVRLIGVDTPETVHPSKTVECFGKEASDFTKSILTGKRIELEVDSTQGAQDKYGRLLGYVIMEDGINFNLLLIQKGYAYEYTYGSAYKYQKQFKDAQATAQTSGNGLWAADVCPEETETTTTPPTTTSGGNYHTSSYSTSKYYYPDSCAAKSAIMDSKYLKSFSTLAELQAKYKRTLSPQCE